MFHLRIINYNAVRYGSVLFQPLWVMEACYSIQLSVPAQMYRFDPNLPWSQNIYEVIFHGGLAWLLWNNESGSVATFWRQFRFAVTNKIVTVNKYLLVVKAFFCQIIYVWNLSFAKFLLGNILTWIWHHISWPALVQVMAHHLFSAKPSPKPMLTCCQMGLWNKPQSIWI